jgi:hypothetical protein
MLIEPMEYVKRPVIVKAMKWSGAYDSAQAIVNWIIENEGDAHVRGYTGRGGASSEFSVYVGDATPCEVVAGEFIVMESEGQFSIYEPDIFREAYTLPEDWTKPSDPAETMKEERNE